MAHLNLGDVADRLLRSLMRHRERYLRAWIAETGAPPSECVLEERLVVEADVAIARTVVVRRQADVAQIASLEGGIVAEARRVATMVRQHEAENADLRDQIALLACAVCVGCGCAERFADHVLCIDCLDAEAGDIVVQHEHVGACISVGLRALAGRRLIG